MRFETRVGSVSISILSASSANVQRVLQASVSTCEAERTCVWVRVRSLNVRTGRTGAF